MHKKKDIASGVFNAIAHIPCCVAPHLAAQSLTSISRFMHSFGGIAFGGFAPPVVTWAVNEISYRFNKNHQCNDGCRHENKNNPLALEWWRENKKSLLIGYGLQVLGFGADALLHDDHNGDEHHNHNHVEQVVPQVKKQEYATYILT